MAKNYRPIFLSGVRKIFEKFINNRSLWVTLIKKFFFLKTSMISDRLVHVQIF